MLTSTPESSSTPEANSPLGGAALVEALRRGGYVIYFRHAASNYPSINSENQLLRGCSRQGNLSEQGRDDARAIGESFLSLNIPVGHVLSSEYCRARDTALLAFGQAQTLEDLTAFPDELHQQRITALHQMLSIPPSPGTNIVLVGHDSNIMNTAGISLAEGEAAVFAPLGEHGFTLVARVLPNEWMQLERLVVGSLLVGPASDPDLMLPDLQTLPPSHVSLRVHSITGQKLLRFTNSIVNNGPGTMELWGYSNPDIQQTIVVQHVSTPSESFRNVPVGEFIFHPAHNHWHLDDFSRYELWSVTPTGGLDSMVALSDKVSYCLRDDEFANLPNTSRFQTYTGCDQKRQGITPGWMDVYKFYLEGQSLDITDLRNGFYALRSIVNPNHQLWESNYANNAAIIYFEIGDDTINVVDISAIMSQSNGGE